MTSPVMIISHHPRTLQSFIPRPRAVKSGIPCGHHDTDEGPDKTRGPRLAPPRLKSPSRQAARSRLPVSTARVSPPRQPVRGTEVEVSERLTVRESRIPKLRQSDSGSSNNEESLETARKLRRNANQYLKSHQLLRSPEQPRDGGGGDPGYQTMDSLDSQPKTFIVSTGTPNTLSPETDEECGGELEGERNNGETDNSATQQPDHQPTASNITSQHQSNPHTLTLSLPTSPPLVRSVSMNEEYITLNIDNNTGPSVGSSGEELRQNTKNVENVRNLDPIYEYCSSTTHGATELRDTRREAGPPWPPHIPGCVPPPVSCTDQSPPGPPPARRYWPEDSLVSPLSRDQRSAKPGSSLPVSQVWNISPAAKSFSLGGYYRDQPAGEKFSLRWSGQRLIQRLSSLRHSVRKRARKLPVVPPPPPEANPDNDRVFFRGFSGVTAHPTAPPRRRKTSKLTRSFSLRSSREGGLSKIEELYPDCPRVPIYAVVDLSKKRRRETNLPDLVTRTGLEDIPAVSEPEDTTTTSSHLSESGEEKTNKMVKSHSANNSPTYANHPLLLDNEMAAAKTKSGHKKRKHKKKREELEHGVTFTGLKGNRPVSSAGAGESGSVRSESWSYQEHQLDIEEAIREVEFLLSSVRTERSRNLQSREAPGQPLLSDIEKQIRQLERGQQTLGQVIEALRELANTNIYNVKDYQGPLGFQARVEVRHRHRRDQRTGRETSSSRIQSRKNSVTRLLQSANRYFSRQSSSSVSPNRAARSVPSTPTTPTSLITLSSNPTSPSNSSRQDGGRGMGRRVSSCEDQTQAYHTADSSRENLTDVAENAGEPRGETRGEMKNKKVPLMIENFERRAADNFLASQMLSVSQSPATTGSSSSRTSVVSSNHSHSTESLEEEKNSSSNTSAGSLTQAQKRERKLHSCVREIMTTERTFVNTLTLINVEFRNFVEKRISDTGKDIIPLEDFRKIFKHLPQLLMFNENLLHDFEDRVENWDSNKKIADVIVKKGHFLKLYTHYIADFESLCVHLEQCSKKYPQFKAVVSEFEKEHCQNLRLSHYFLKPVQRLPQYKLMLEEYMKHLEPNSLDFDDTTQALTIVANAAEHANTTVKKGEGFQQLLHLQNRLGDFELIRPGRELVKEGEVMKISRKEVVPRYFILLTDCLLYCSHFGAGAWVDDNSGLRVSYEIMLNHLKVTVPTVETFQTEFSITSNVRSFTVRTGDVNERNDWVEAINSAIEEYNNKKASFLPDPQGSLDLSGGEALGDAAPVWTPDQRVCMCQLCAIQFSLVVRRHHCRACGKVVCSGCSNNKAPIKYRQFETVRVCHLCYDILKKKYEQHPELQSRFKRTGNHRKVGPHIPQRLKMSANPEESQMCGYLKLRGRGGRWKESWWVLKDNIMFRFNAAEDIVAQESLPVPGWRLETLSDKNFELYEEMSPSLVFQLSHTAMEAMVFCADNDNFAEKWTNALREATTLSIPE